MKCDKCNTEVPDNGSFCPDCGNKMQGGFLQKLNLKSNLKTKVIIAVSILILCVLGFVLYENTGKRNLPGESAIKRDLKDKEIRVDKQYFDISTGRIDKVKILDNIESNEGNDNHVEANIDILTKTYNVNVDASILYEYGDGWKFAEVKFKNINITPVKGIDDSELSKALEDKSFEHNEDLKEKWVIGKSSVSDLKITSRSGNIKNNTENVEFSCKLKNNISTVNVNLKASMNFENSKWNVQNLSLNGSRQIKLVYNDDIENPNIEEDRIKNVFAQNVVCLAKLVSKESYSHYFLRKVFTPEGFKELKIDKVKYTNDGSKITSTVSAKYDDSECTFEGNFEIVASLKDKNWDVEISTTGFDKQIVKSVPVGDLHYELMIKEYFYLGNPVSCIKEFKLISRERKGNQETLVGEYKIKTKSGIDHKKVSMTYNYENEFFNTNWHGLSVEDIK